MKLKRVILIEIVKNDYPSYWEDDKQFLKDLQEIQRSRNKLAHSVVDVSDEALERPTEDGDGYVEWKKGAPITDEDFQEWEVRTNMLMSTLSDIKRLLPFKEQPRT